MDVGEGREQDGGSFPAAIRAGDGAPTGESYLFEARLTCILFLFYVAVTD
jgi:hypothetical protein